MKGSSKSIPETVQNFTFNFDLSNYRDIRDYREIQRMKITYVQTEWPSQMKLTQFLVVIISTRILLRFWHGTRLILWGKFGYRKFYYSYLFFKDTRWANETFLDRFLIFLSTATTSVRSLCSKTAKLPTHCGEKDFIFEYFSSHS